MEIWNVRSRKTQTIVLVHTQAAANEAFVASAYNITLQANSCPDAVSHPKQKKPTTEVSKLLPRLGACK